VLFEIAVPDEIVLSALTLLVGHHICKTCLRNDPVSSGMLNLVTVA